jgi:fatty-acyl-CoA synthase
VPREVVFLSELPRNPTGKILKRELRNIEID